MELEDTYVSSFIHTINWRCFMKTYIKVFIISCILSVFYISIFNFFNNFNTVTYYVYQVGIYKEENNKDKKIKEIKNNGLNGYFYKKDNQYYVLSMITTNKTEIIQHSYQYKGIIKEYQVNNNMDIPSFLNSLEEINL